MAPAILADSDDDGEAEDLAPDAAQQEASNNNSGYDTFQAYYAAQENSTGSTERLRRQIASAERGLCINSAPVASVSQHSPSRKVHARSFTTWPEPAASDKAAERSVKRAKSMKTFSSTHQLKPGDDENVAMSSGRQSDRISDHSGQHSSGGLPSGSIGQDFLIHEPTVMFPESGSTVEDPSSMQRQLFDNAVHGEDSDPTVLRTSKSQGFKEAGVEASSTEWSAWTDSSHERNRIQEQLENEHNVGEDGDVNAGSQVANVMDQEAREEDTSPNADTQASTSVANGSRNSFDVSKPAASPTVQIPQAERSLGSPDQASQTSTRKRKRKTVDADGSDDELAALGLQKEMYKPRPSRRRATHSAEDNASLVSLSQEKTKSKSSKRRKTTQADTSSGHQSQRKAESVEPMSIDTSQKPSETQASNQTRSKEQDSSQTKHVSDTISHNDHGKDNVQQDSLSQQEPVSSSTSKQDDDVFVKPPKPTPKAKAKAKSRRSQTTIYEDLTKFSEPERSPSLSQQQASRKSALRDLHNDEDHSSSPRKRKRTTSVMEEETNENEIVNDESQEDKPPPPKKRGRGRPRKSSPKPQPKSSEKVLEDSEDGGDQDELVKGVDSPRKDSRRATSKSQNSDLDPVTNSHNGSEENGGNDASASTEEHHGEAITSPTNSNGTQQKEVSPSSASTTTAASAPEKGKSSKDTPAKSAAAAQSKHSPTSHSPLKSSCKVPLRVGLNKRQRIPSLLRTIKPPRPR